MMKVLFGTTPPSQNTPSARLTRQHASSPLFGQSAGSKPVLNAGPAQDTVAIRFGQGGDDAKAKAGQKIVLPDVNPSDIEAFAQDEQIRQAVIDFVESLPMALRETLSQALDANARQEEPLPLPKLVRRVLREFMEARQHDIQLELDNIKGAILNNRPVSALSRDEQLDLAKANFVATNRSANLQMYMMGPAMRVVQELLAEKAPDDGSEPPKAPQAVYPFDMPKEVKALLQPYMDSLHEAFRAASAEALANAEQNEEVEAAYNRTAQQFALQQEAAIEEESKTKVEALLKGRSPDDLTDPEEIRQYTAITMTHEAKMANLQHYFESETAQQMFLYFVQGAERAEREISEFSNALNESIDELMTALISDPEWVNHQLGLKEMSEEAIEEKVRQINTALPGHLAKMAQVIDRLYLQKLQTLQDKIGQVDPRKMSAEEQTRLMAELPAEPRIVLGQANYVYMAQSELLAAAQHKMVERFQKFQKNFMKAKMREVWAPINERIAALKTDNAALAKLIEYTREEEPDVRATSFHRLVSYLGDSSNPADQTLLVELLHIMPDIPMANVKVHGAHAMLTLEDDKTMISLMKEWLRHPDVNTGLAVMTAFSSDNPTIVNTAFRLLRKDDELRAMVIAFADQHPDNPTAKASSLLILGTLAAQRNKEERVGRSSQVKAPVFRLGGPQD